MTKKTTRVRDADMSIEMFLAMLAQRRLRLCMIFTLLELHSPHRTHFLHHYFLCHVLFCLVLVLVWSWWSCEKNHFIKSTPIRTDSNPISGQSYRIRQAHSPFHPFTYIYISCPLFQSDSFLLSLLPCPFYSPSFLAPLLFPSHGPIFLLNETILAETN